MALPLLMIVVGLILLVWSAGIFVDGAAMISKYMGVPPLLIGMLVIGFGTSAPELAVSAISALQNNPGVALGNAYGSNIANIGLILGITAIIKPIAVESNILKRELPILFGVTMLALLLILDGEFSRLDALVQLLTFAGVMVWMARQTMRQKQDSLEREINAELEEKAVSRDQALIWLLAGLLLLIGSSRALVWGAVALAQNLGVSDLIIGLTVIAVGTSLPELASAIAAARKGQDDLALGNILGSNLFNTLMVVGLAGAIQPMSIPREILHRDWPLMAALTASMFLLGAGGNQQPSSIRRTHGLTLLAIYFAYTAYLIHSVTVA